MEKRIHPLYKCVLSANVISDILERQFLKIENNLANREITQWRTKYEDILDEFNKREMAISNQYLIKPLLEMSDQKMGSIKFIIY